MKRDPAHVAGGYGGGGVSERWAWHFILVSGWIVWVWGEPVAFAIKLAGFVICALLVYWSMVGVRFLISTERVVS